MKLRLLIPAFFLLAISLCAQSAPVSVYAESFRKGTTHIAEEKFDLKLTPQDRSFSEHLRDAQGYDHYLLTIVPIGPNGDTTITSWQVRLTDLSRHIYPNILLTSLREDAADDPRNQLGQLNPSNFTAVPIKAKRIIKVDSFYLVLEVKSYHFTPLDSPYLDSMTVGLELTNTDPRTATDTSK